MVVKIGAIGNLKSFTQGWQELFVDVIEYSRHSVVRGFKVKGFYRSELCRTLTLERNASY